VKHGVDAPVPARAQIAARVGLLLLAPTQSSMPFRSMAARVHGLIQVLSPIGREEDHAFKALNLSARPQVASQ
jgi:hypothetical protein